MAITMKQVIKALSPDEPKYKKAAQLGSEALPHLKKLVMGEDLALASKAACLAGYIAADDSTEVLLIAAHHANPVVRVAAAGAAGRLKKPQDASEILLGLAMDDDQGVCRVALDSLGPWATDDLRKLVKEISTSAPQTLVREHARKALKRLPRR